MTDLDLLVLRFDAPLMSFGGVRVDQENPTDRFPSRSLITGLVGNALGYDHREADRLKRLQQRLLVATRCDRPGRLLQDFQTVDLGQPHMEPGWTTRHAPATREGASSKGTHIRYRDFLNDSVYTVVVGLEPEDEQPRLEQVQSALESPERPLFLGRKTCLPSLPLVIGRLTAPSLVAALERAPLSDRAAEGERTFGAWWPDHPREPADSTDRVPTFDRDWHNQWHSGRRHVCHGKISLAEDPHDA